MVKGLEKELLFLVSALLQASIIPLSMSSHSEGLVALARSSGSLSALSLVNFCSLSLPKWTDALLLSHYIKKIKIELTDLHWWLVVPVHLPMMGFSDLLGSHLLTPLCYPNMEWETPALQLAVCCMVWCWMLTILGDKSQWKLGKVWQSVSSCVTTP